MKKGCLIVLTIFIVLVLIGSLLPDDKNTVSTSENDNVKVSANTVEQTKKSVESKWVYEEDVDEMTDSKVRYAYLKSDNEVEFDFPYNGGSYLTVVIRESKRKGMDAYIKISSGQFIINEYNGDNKISVRFDDNEPIKYTMLEPADISTDVLFFRDSKGFVEKCKSAKVIKIEPSFFQEGRRVFTFTTPVPLKWD